MGDLNIPGTTEGRPRTPIEAALYGIGRRRRLAPEEIPVSLLSRPDFPASWETEVEVQSEYDVIVHLTSPAASEEERVVCKVLVRDVGLKLIEPYQPEWMFIDIIAPSGGPESAPDAPDE